MTDHDTLISAAELRRMCGGISDMTVWRWLRQEDDPLPPPIQIVRRNYWRLADVKAWIDRRDPAKHTKEGEAA